MGHKFNSRRKMFKMCLCGFWYYYFILHSLVVVSGFNLSPKHAMVFKDPSGQEGSYFGYAVALQQDGWLLVGAPRGNSTQPNHLNITEPGMVYQCQIEGDAKCASQLLDSAGNDHNKEGRYLQHKHNAWAGVSLDVMDGKNGKIAVCGPRWVNLFYEATRGELVSGICYITDVSNSEKDAEKLMPLNNLSKYSYTKQPNDTDGIRIMSYYYAYGQFGMSVHFTRDGEEMIVGAPGVMDWRGTVVRYKTNDRRIPVIPNPLRTSQLRNYTYTYVGYSVSSGNFLSGKNKTYYVSGAPRAGKDYQGKVYVFDFHNATLAGDEHRIEIIQELEGKQVGEYFGAALCVLDVNGDGLDDILVGAPHYGAAKAWDQGRIYVHLTTNATEKITFVSTEILGSRQSGAQYGAAVSSLGDINKDGYNDFVVGAPYEDAGTGVIYVYHGGKAGPSREVSQRIVGSEIRSDILGFGISFSRSLDIDGNNYTDIAVGAYKSGHAIVLKTRPIIKYEASITADVSSIGFNATSFSIKACIAHKGKNVPPTVGTIVILKLDRIYQRVRPQNITYEVTVSKSAPVCNNHSVKIEPFLQDFSKPIELWMEYMPKEESNGDTFCKSCPVVDPKKPSSVKSALPYATGCLNDEKCTPSLNITAEFMDFVPPLIIGSQPTVSMKVTVQNSEEPAFLAYALISLPESCPLVRIPQSCETVEKSGEGVSGSSPEQELKCLIGNPVSKGKKRTVQLDFDVKHVASGTEELVFNLSVISAGTELTPHDNSNNVTLSFITQTDIGLLGFSDRDKVVLSKRTDTKETKTEFSHIYELKNVGPSPLNKVDLEFKIPVSHVGAKNLITIYDIKAQNDGKHVSCVRSDTGLVKLIKSLNLSIKSKPRNTTEQITFSDQTAAEYEDATESSNTSKYEDTTESGNTSKFEDTTESGNTSKFEDTTESGNKSKSEDTLKKLRSINIVPDLAGPRPTQPPEGKLHIDCKNPETTCVTVNCSLYGPIKNTSRAHIYFSMSATLEDLESLLGSTKAIVFSTTGKARIASPKNVQQAQTNSTDETDVTTVLQGKIKVVTFDRAIIGGAAAGAVLLVIIIILILWKYGFFKRKRPEEQYKALIKKQRDE